MGGVEDDDDLAAFAALECDKENAEEQPGEQAAAESEPKGNAQQGSRSRRP